MKYKDLVLFRKIFLASSLDNISSLGSKTTKGKYGGVAEREAPGTFSQISGFPGHFTTERQKRGTTRVPEKEGMSQGQKGFLKAPQNVRDEQAEGLFSPGRSFR